MDLVRTRQKMRPRRGRSCTGLQEGCWKEIEGTTASADQAWWKMEGNVVAAAKKPFECSAARRRERRRGRAGGKQQAKTSQERQRSHKREIVRTRDRAQLRCEEQRQLLTGDNEATRRDDEGDRRSALVTLGEGSARPHSDFAAPPQAIGAISCSASAGQTWLAPTGSCGFSDLFLSRVLLHRFLVCATAMEGIHRDRAARALDGLEEVLNSIVGGPRP